MKYAYTACERTHYPIGFMCRAIEVSTSGFFSGQARARPPRSDADTPLREVIVHIHQESRRRYGRQCLTDALRARGWRVTAKRVRRVMREKGLRDLRKGRFVPLTTDSAHQRAIAAEVLQRRFGAVRAEHTWASNFTYIATGEGWLYLAAVINLQTRQVHSYSLSDRMSDELMLNALPSACHREAPPSGALFHFNRGSQYISDDFRDALRALGMATNMSRKRNFWDSVVSEGFFETLKIEKDERTVYNQTRGTQRNRRAPTRILQFSLPALVTPIPVSLCVCAQNETYRLRPTQQVRRVWTISLPA
ncbi:MAG: IS3 family transposase [Gammaproteobacteria bacterium]|nr:IS3 family transposase [Gammaproteobacteria bacterium]